MTRVLIVYCHPVPDSFCASLRDLAVEALQARGWDARVLDLYASGFDPVLSTAERRAYNEGAPTDATLAPHFELLKWAEAILFVYPTWWYGLPAMLKGWLDRVWATDVAFTLPADGGRIISLVSGIKRIGIVTTCGAPWLFSFLIGQPGRKTLLRGIRALCAQHARTLYVAHYDMDRSTPASRLAFIKTVRRRLSRW